MSFKKRLLGWIQSELKVKPYCLDIKNFHKDWHNGKAFLGLIHCLDGTAFKYNDMKDKKKEEILEFAFDKGLEVHKIAKLLDVDDVTYSKKPDPIIIITYLSTIYKYYASNKKKIDRTKLKVKKLQGEDASMVKKMHGRIEQLNKKREENAKKNWNFLKKETMKKISVNFEEIYAMLESQGF